MKSHTSICIETHHYAEAKTLLCIGPRITNVWASALVMRNVAHRYV